MLFKFNLEIPAPKDEDDIEVKTRLVMDKIYAKFPQYDLHGVNGHISISMQDNNYKVWVFIYDEDGIHESESKGKIIKKPLNIVRRHPIRPTKAQIDSINFGVRRK